MNRLAGALALICFLLGGMIGYSWAYGKIYRELKANKQKNLVSPPSSLKPAPSFSSESAPFSQVITQASGQKVLALDSVCEPVLDAIEQASSATIEKLNSPTSPLIGLRRINEASRHFEDSLLLLLDGHPDIRCQIPLTQEGKAQRSGYPDLMLVHEPTGRVYYLDPKLYETSSRDSSLRTFYYTPRKETSKILKAGHHLLIGFGHDGKDGQWTFESWSLVDLSKTSLKLKSEYNSSNKELYRPESIVRSGS